MLDRLSDMPWDILDNILGCLPIKDAVRTSVLSRKWRYTWVYLSNIVFYDRCKGFPVAFDNLKALELSEVCFNELDEISVFLSLLERSFSNLKSLCISAFGPFNQDVYKLMAAQNQLSYCFNQLQIVKINIALCHQYVGAFQCWRSDLEFIKLVLARSPVLEKMLVGYNYPEDCDLWFMRKLLSFERASSQLVFKYSSSPNPELYTVSSFLHDWDLPVLALG
ncbi:unnamed protein product [Ilex paraguariensis]|uniref:F-box domain-containing protein n=1 Tax=Ilex paraguariensis TaxID=185542 RepID=A0ABC8UXY4_9AQUA